MKPGSVIVDLAAETGGNCELTEAGETVVHEGVTIVGPVNLPASMPDHASPLYARNVQSLLELMVKEGELSSGLRRRGASPAPASRATARSSTRARAPPQG